MILSNPTFFDASRDRKRFYRAKVVTAETARKKTWKFSRFFGRARGARAEKIEVIIKCPNRRAT